MSVGSFAGCGREKESARQNMYDCAGQRTGSRYTMVYSSSGALQQCGVDHGIQGIQIFFADGLNLIPIGLDM